jgi:hypothetical protein
MNNFELINEFLDGTLDSSEEEQLFSSLSSDSDLRLELKQQMAIKSAVRSDLAAFTPKTASTLKIFSELGLVLPAPAPVIVPTFGTQVLSFLKTNAGYIYTGLLSAAAAFVVAFLLFDVSSNNLQNNGQAKIIENKSTQIPVISNLADDNFDSKSLSKNNSNDDINQKSNSLDKPKVIYKYIYVKDTTENINQEIADNSENINKNISDISDSRIVNNFDNSNKLMFLNSNSTSRVFPLQESMTRFVFPESGVSSDNNLALELRGSSYQSESLSQLSNGNLSLLNTGITAYYKFDDELKIGIDYRRESFFQRFSGKENGNFYIFEQQPNFETVSLAAKYNPEYLKISNLSPFAFTSVGANASGPVVRAMIGTDIYFSSSIYMNFGFDYNLLLYSQNNTRFVSSKTGIHIGAGYNF